MISQIADLISKPAFWALLVLGVIYFAFAAYVDSLDAPTEKDSVAYKHWFKWANNFCFRMKRAAIAFHIPQGEDKDASAN
jgi:3-methyladenine DNA glycosylase AlkD